MAIRAGLPGQGGNRFYAGNRAPLTASPLIKLPLGSVHPEGWLRHQLDLTADGYSGHLAEISRFCRFDGNAWTSRSGEGQFGWEEVPYWLKGFVDLAYLTGDRRLLAESSRWLSPILEGQFSNGYFGSRTNLEDAESGARVLDLWPNMVMLYPLRSYYEATGDARVLSFMTKYFRWQMTVPLEKFLPGSWQKWRGGDNLDSIYWLYNRTGDRWLLDLARVTHERTADWAGDIPTWHGVNLAQGFREPAQFYQQTHDERYLKATERVYQTVMGLYGQFPGGVFAADENARPGFSDPRQGTETCAIVELMHSHELLLAITGSSVWADRAEEVAFNSLPAAMTPDLKGLHYLTGANLIQLDRASKAPFFDNDGDQQSYNPYQYRCCQHNSGFGWPYFAERLWMATEGNGLAATLYAPGSVTARVGDGTEVTIKEQTDYPFGESLAFTVAAPRAVRFPLSFRLPAWCSKPAVRVNGTATSPFPTTHDWITIDRIWANGDRVDLALPMTIRVRTWEYNRGAVSVDRGPLTYSLKIGERWQRYGSDPTWPAYEVFPTTAWNYGLVLNEADPGASFKVEHAAGAIAPQPFTPGDSPIVLHARGRKILEWMQEPNGLVGIVPESPVRSDERDEDLTLVPMGCARLRISAFPRVTSGPDAQRWDPNPPLATASRAWHFMPPSAMNDGRVPNASSDRTVPWFVWWDTYGTEEWAEYSFSRPRRLGSVDVYWADENLTKSSGRVPSDVRLQTPTDGRVRLPAAYRIEWWDGKAWQPVTEIQASDIRADGFNRATFVPVTTTAVRLVVKLQPRQSAGILEWRVGE